MHYSFDYAQQVHFPSNPQQPGPAFFLTARKCQVFGVACEPLGTQVNYLIDESESVGKGANATVSMIEHYLANHGQKEDHLRLHADNCVRQNKNNCLIQYLLRRVILGHNKTAILSFMLPGHKICSRQTFWSNKALQEDQSRHHEFPSSYCAGLISGSRQYTSVGCYS